MNKKKTPRLTTFLPSSKRMSRKASEWRSALGISNWRSGNILADQVGERIETQSTQLLARHSIFNRFHIRSANVSGVESREWTEVATVEWSLWASIVNIEEPVCRVSSSLSLLELEIRARLFTSVSNSSSSSSSFTRSRRASINSLVWISVGMGCLRFNPAIRRPNDACGDQIWFKQSSVSSDHQWLK